jgi:2,3-bisphosphoglycerate-independent phosphoglycerate mutase
MSELFVRPKPLIIAILDGLGVAPPSPGNAVSLAHTPNLDEYWPRFPHCYLNASGLHVGLPNGIDGNSEVGHMNLGAGKVIFQELPRIDNSIDNGSFNANPLLKEALLKSLKNDVHIMGLLGSGSVHSAYPHISALLNMAQELKADGKRIYIHIFTDGRDSPPQGAIKLLDKLEIDFKRTGIGKVATLIGRYYAMDRDERWERTKKAYDLITLGVGEGVSNWAEALQKSYDKKITDEYLDAYFIKGENGNPVAVVKPEDSVIFVNFRADRAVQLTRAFEDTEFPGWQRDIIPNLFFVGFSNYEKGFPKNQAFPPERISNPFGKVISDNGLRQLRISESEKYPHVTYFYNGGNQIQYPGEDRIEVPSPKDVATYDLKPEMSAYQLTDVLLKKIEEDIYDVIIVNFANPDMVAHTGVIDASIKAIEVTDECIGKIYRFIKDKGGAIIATADHGNAEEMIDLQTGNVDTKHSTNPVPLMILKDGLDARELPFGILADISPTALALLGLQKPIEMTGRDLMV